MTAAEFAKTLTAEQQANFNEVLLAQRAELQEAFAINEQTLVAAHTETLTALTITLAEKETELASKEELIVALGGTEVGQQMAKEAELAKLTAEEEAIAAKAIEIAKRKEELTKVAVVEEAIKE